MTNLALQKIKSYGQFYTPIYIVDFIIENTLGHILRNKSLEETKYIKILDPACGLGIFLVQSVDFLEKRYQNGIDNVNSIDKARKLIIAEQIYGIDIDSSQIKQTQQNLECSLFSTNLKVFNALLPPKESHFQFNTKRLKYLRKLSKKHYIKGDKTLLEKKQNEIWEIENKVKEELIKELIQKYDLSSEIHPMVWDIVFPEVIGGFDIIIGNPPWGADNSVLTTKVLADYLAGTRQTDTWSLFVERCIKSLKDNGRLGFIIPNTLISNENYQSIREFILKECQIISIINLGENIFPHVTQPCMILILEKGLSNKEKQIEIIQHISSKSLEDLSENRIPLSYIPNVKCLQSRFQNNFDFQFDIFSIGFEKILKRIEKDLNRDQIQVKPLKMIVKNARGVEINKKGRIIQCTKCNWWNPPLLPLNSSGIKHKTCVNPECSNTITEHDKEDYIVFNSPQTLEQDQPFLVGHQVQRYYLHNHLYIDPTRKGINYKKSTMYQGPKLLLRKTGHGIKIAIDYHNRWVNQVIYFFKLNTDTLVSLEYLLGILNSVLIQKYFFLKYADPYRKDFPHLTQKIFLKLPIKIPRSSSDQRIADQIHKTAVNLQSKYQNLYDEQMDLSNARLVNQQIKQLEKRMNNFVYSIYGLDSQMQDQIRNLFQFNPSGINQ